MFDSDVRVRVARGTVPERMLFAGLVLLVMCANSFAGLAPPASNGVIAFDGGAFINPDGSGLTFWPYRNAENLAWSPDGKKIAFEGDYYDQGCSCIFVANPDGSGLTPLTIPNDGEDKWPAWSPDGSKIIFTRTSPGLLYVMNADGSNPVALPLQGQRPSWSADGTKIVYGGWGQIWIANADGTDPTVLNTGIYFGWWPAWSRDGSKIAFIGSDPNAPYTTWSVFTISPDGSNLTQVTSGVDDFDPAWSPDGTQLAFLRLGTVSADGLYVTNADGSGQPLLIAGGSAYFPAWQPIPTGPVAFPFAGFFSPLGAAGTLNDAKAGSSVPIKFSLGGNRGLDVLAAGSPATQPIACASAGATSTASASGSAGSSGLSYDAFSDLYTYVMKTDKAWANTCRRLTVTLSDGTSHTADFTFN